MRRLSERGTIVALIISGMLAAFTDLAAAYDGLSANRPAVSRLNGRATIFGGYLGDSISDSEMVALGGVLAMPFGHRFGLQGDAMLAYSHGEFGGGIAGHAFWRDPSVGLLGLYGQWVARHQPNWKTWRGGVEAHAYVGDFDFGGIVGYESPVLFEGYGNHDDAFAIVDVAYYVSGDMRASAGYRYLNGVNIGALDLELQSPDPSWPRALTMTLSGRVGERDYAAVWLGITWNFWDNPKSLRARHREDTTIDTEKESIFQMDLDRAYRR